MKIDDPLLSAVLSDAAALREATRRQVLGLARRRRRGRAGRRAFGVAAVLALGAVLWRASLERGEKEIAPAGVAVVRSGPLPAEALVTTRGEMFAPVGSSFVGLALVGTRPLDITITETRLAMPAVDFLDDRQLLAAFPGGRAALIDAGTPRARVIFY